RRAAYNATLPGGSGARSAAPARARRTPEPPAEPVVLERALREAPGSLAEEVEDWTARWTSGLGVKKSGRRQPLVIEVLLSPWEAVRGGELPIRLPTVVRCEGCAGTGTLWSFTCSTCGGGGALPGEAVVYVPIPPGVVDSLAYDVAVEPLGLDLRVLLRRDRRA
ncbi:MAG: hypothetical protein AB1689_20950, partial [Thermodesulfobacteriota bacterium]